MVKVSVIVPVYNAQEYIVPCVESLLGQSLDDIEILLVDDHGTDDSIATVRRYLEGNTGKKLVRFLETPVNSGPGAARNIGIDAAAGEYVAFVDSDDWVERDFCGSLYEAVSANDADLAFCHLLQDNAREGSSIELRNPDVSSGVFSEKEHKRFLASFVSYFTTFLYRREFLLDNALRFPRTNNSEDSCFLASCILAAQRIASVDKPLYHYVLRNQSLTYKVDSAKYKQKLYSFDAFMAYAKDHGLYDGYKDEIDFIYIKKAFLMAALTYVSNEPKPDPAALDELCSAMTRQVPDYASNHYIRNGFKFRTLIRLIKNYPRLAILLLKMLAKKRKV